jgi:hypothetical protein
VSWQLVYAKQALKDATKLSAAGLKPKAQTLPAILADGCSKRFIYCPSGTIDRFPLTLLG